MTSLEFKDVSLKTNESETSLKSSNLKINTMWLLTSLKKNHKNKHFAHRIKGFI
jgi:hypothetical protein